jgi:uncharacterized protein (DUF2147 family)
MKKSFFSILAVLSLSLLLSASTNVTKDTFVGTWLVQDKDAKVELYIKSDGTLEGKCVWHKDPNKKDDKNKNPELRSRSVIGLKVVWDFKWNEADKTWEDGKVYKEGSVYCGTMKMNPDGTLYLKGAICSMSFLGKTNTWTRVK